jgi:endonuclease/exonuclease/phosphatase family metal-dependent hydrolase
VVLLVRTWNVFHGNVVPPERRGFLEAMVRLATADAPDVLCLQEVPVWALRRLRRWSGMTALGAVAAPPRLLSAELGRAVTALHHGLFRSAVTGQANAILLAPSLRAENPVDTVISESGERRVCQAVRVADVGLVANFHVTGGASADAQFRRAADFADELGERDERVILAGDANLRPGSGDTYSELHDRGFSEPLAGSIDQVLVRGLPSTSPMRWPDDRRVVGGRLLSDHAPVEVRVG